MTLPPECLPPGWAQRQTTMDEFLGIDDPTAAKRRRPGFVVGFDVDGTLISEEDDSPNWPMIDLLRQFHALGATIIVWSGGGVDYAGMWVRRLNLTPFVKVLPKTIGATVADLAIDDEEVTLGLANFKVARA